MIKYITAFALLCSATAFAQKTQQIIYDYCDSMYFECVMNDALRVLHRKHKRVKDIQYQEIDGGNIVSFMIVYEDD